LQNSRYQNFEAKPKTKVSSSESSTASAKFPTESVAEEIKPVNTEHFEFQNRDVSKQIALFANFGQPKT